MSNLIAKCFYENLLLLFLGEFTIAYQKHTPFAVLRPWFLPKKVFLYIKKKITQSL